ncbi:hypothetical protein AB0P05_09460 [Streptomyces flaveolus]|uniref:hypothetical protein n=1 Tax=Streptomyces flaveolus TaxID=67297 RepID=UPI00343FC195
MADEDAFRLSAFFDSCYDDSDPVEALRDAVMDQFPPEGDEGLFTAVARKASPFSALAYPLGPDAVLRLPGCFGDFLLDAAQVRAQLPVAEEALALTGTQRRDAVERIHAWMTGLGDDPTMTSMNSLTAHCAFSAMPPVPGRVRLARSAGTDGAERSLDHGEIL